jgi:DNA polymerase-3 subunit delta
VVALRTSEVESFLARPSSQRTVILIYGPDLGLVRERADALVKAIAPDAGPLAVVPLEGDALAADPGRLLDEANTVGLFGGRRVLRIRAGTRSFNAGLEAILADPPPKTTIVIEAGELRRGAPLRSLCENSKAAATIACYADGERDLLRLVEGSLAAAGLTIDSEAREALVGLIGADRLASRSELDKLVLYATGSDRIALEDVRAVIADASALAIDDVADAAAAGEPQAALTALAKTRRAGISPATVIGAIIRHVANLHRLRLAIDQGESLAGMLERSHPKIHFRREPLVIRALERSTTESLQTALVALGQSALSARRTPPLANAIAERAILALSQGTRKRGQPRRGRNN